MTKYDLHEFLLMSYLSMNVEGEVTSPQKYIVVNLSKFINDIH